MANRCDGCSGKGYAGELRLNSTPCVLCAGTGRGHVHAWRYRGALASSAAVGRTCDGCGKSQVAPAKDIQDAPKGYEAIWDAPWSEAAPSEYRELSKRRGS